MCHDVCLCVNVCVSMRSESDICGICPWSLVSKVSTAKTAHNLVSVSIIYLTLRYAFFITGHTTYTPDEIWRFNSRGSNPRRGGHWYESPDFINNFNAFFSLLPQGATAIVVTLAAFCTTIPYWEGVREHINNQILKSGVMNVLDEYTVFLSEYQWSGWKW